MRIALISSALALAVTVEAASAEPVWVQVRESVVRSKPQYYAPGVLPVRYGERVEKLSQSTGWARVRVKNIEGYLPLSSVSLDQIVLQARELERVSADTSDVVLAGKGFNKEVEKEYRNDDPSARFDLVDKVEREARASSSEVAQFKKSGGLP
ncbi:MAG: hypothetical protein RL326_2186 [Pseudomonadota bacterium]|jgi:hypothetical protein